MEIANDVLVRIAGQEFCCLERLNLKDTLPLLLKYDQKRNEVDHLKDKAIELIFEAIQKEQDKALQNSLLQLKRDIFNNRKYNKSILNNAQFSNALAAIEQLELVAQEFSEAHNSFEQSFKIEYTSTKIALKEIASLPAFKNGIILSSSILTDSAKRYLTGQSSKKRDSKTEIGLISYISRIAAKTSPFSSFTNLTHGRIEDIETPINFKVHNRIKSKVSLNNTLLKSIIGIIKRSSVLSQNIPIVLNQTLQVEKGVLTYITNSNNSEAIQTIQQNPFLKSLIKLLVADGIKTLKSVCEKLAEDHKLENESVAIFLKQLLNLGLIEFDFNTSGADEYWVDNLLSMFEGIPEIDSFYEKLRDYFSKIDAIRLEYEISSPEIRQDLLKTLSSEVNSLFDFLKEFCLEKEEVEGEKKEDEKSEQEKSETEKPEDHVDSSEVFRHRDPIQLKFVPQRIIFEDTLIESDIAISRQAVSDITNKIELFLSNLKALNPYRKEQGNIKDFYKENYSASAEVPLIEFYKNYKKNKSENETKDLNSVSYLWFQNKVCDLIDQMDDPEKEVFNFDTKDLFPAVEIKRNSSSGSFLQFFVNDKKQLSCVVNGVFLGHNKYFGRFITLFDKTVQTDVLSWSREDWHSELLIENCDSTYFNANIHPPLLNYEINMPGSQSTYPKDKRISVADLAVKYVNETDTVELVHLPTQKKVSVFDLGFQTIKARSSLYVFLSNFDSPSTSMSLYYFCSIVNKKIVHKLGRAFVFPRIVLDDRIVIQRKTWHIQKKNLPTFAELDEVQLFIEVNEWRRKLSLPDQVFFVTQSQVDVHSEERKPQYLDFRSPLLVNLFVKKLVKVEKTLVIREMLPGSDQLFKSDEKKFVSEYLVQWRS